MTEERRKELAEECYAALPVRATKDTFMNCVRDFFRTVAAEARKKGIEEFETAMSKAHPVSLTYIHRTAERLKEQQNDV